MEINKKLKSKAMFSIVVNSMVGVRLLTLPRDVERYAGVDSWISILLIGAISLVNGYAFYWVAIQYPGLFIPEINLKIYGRFLGRVVTLIKLIYILSAVGLSLRLFANSIDLFLLESTPLIVIILTMLLAVLYCITRDIRSISIIFDLVLPGILFFMFTFFLFTTTAADRANILPVLHKGLLPVVKGAFQVVDPLLALGVIVYVMPYFEDPKSTKKWVMLGIGVSVVIYFLIMLLCILVFGSDEIDRLVFPVLTLTKAIQVETQIFERVESLAMAAWIPISFTTITVYYLASIINLRTFFNAKKNSWIIYGQIPIFIAIALLPKNLEQLEELLVLNNYIAILITFVYLPITVIVVYIRKRRGLDG